MEHVNLLQFSAHHLSFGVCAEQIEELLEDRAPEEQEEKNTAYTIRYKGQDLRVTNFSRWIEKERGTEQKESFEVQGSNPVSESREHDDLYLPSPKILIIKHQDEGYTGVRIDDLEDLATVSITHIHSLPVIMQKTKRIQGLWGIALVKSRPVILIDLTQV